MDIRWALQRFVLVSLVFAHLIVASVAAAAAGLDPGTERGWREPSITKQPGGPFAALVWSTGALGDYLNVVFWEVSDPAFPPDSGWSLTNRFWSEYSWASDVTSLVWAPDGSALYVATEGIYGSGRVFRLWPWARQVEQLWPEDQSITNDMMVICEIDTLDCLLGQLHVRIKDLEDLDDETLVSIDVVCTSAQ